MAASRPEDNPQEVPAKDVDEYQMLYMHCGDNFRLTFANFLDCVLPDSDISEEFRKELIDFYSQVLHWFANPGSQAIINVFKKFQSDLKDKTPVQNNQKLNLYKNVEYAERFGLLWPKANADLLAPLEFDHSFAKVIIEQLQSIGFNPDPDEDHFAIPQLLGVFPYQTLETLIQENKWFKEFSSAPTADTLRHGAWSHCIQLYIIIQLVKDKIIKIEGPTSLPDLLKACTLKLKKQIPGLRNIFDIVFEQRDQFELILELASETDNEKNFALLLNEVSPYDVGIYPYFSLSSPDFLSSFIGVLHRYVADDLSHLSVAWLHKMVKLNFNSGKRNNPEEINDEILVANPQKVMAAINSDLYFFKNAPAKTNFKDVNLNKFTPDFEFIDKANQKGIFYRKKNT